MQRSGVPAWGAIGRMAVLSSLLGAVVTFFVLPDSRWIAAIFVGVAVLDALIFGLVLPRLAGGGSGGAPTIQDLERMNAEADWETATDDPAGEKRPFDV